MVKNKIIKKSSPSGNWTPVSRVTGGDTNHYTNEDTITIKNFDTTNQVKKMNLLYTLNSESRYTRAEWRSGSVLGP